MQNGFIISTVKEIINAFYYLNLVEFFKFIAKKLTPINSSQDIIIRNSNIAIDIFIILKWLFIFLIWKVGVDNTFMTFFVFYLIITNIYTYFYYHVWLKVTQPLTYERNIRRFINLILAYSYSNFCYGYLYSVPYYSEMNWTQGFNKDINGLLFSIANSLTSSIEGVKILTTMGNWISVSQVSLSFFFISIILSKSIPQD